MVRKNLKTEIFLIQAILLAHFVIALKTIMSLLLIDQAWLSLSAGWGVLRQDIYVLAAYTLLGQILAWCCQKNKKVFAIAAFLFSGISVYQLSLCFINLPTVLYTGKPLSWATLKKMGSATQGVLGVTDYLIISFAIIASLGLIAFVVPVLTSQFKNKMSLSFQRKFGHFTFIFAFIFLIAAFPSFSISNSSLFYAQYNPSIYFIQSFFRTKNNILEDNTTSSNFQEFKKDTETFLPFQVSSAKGYNVLFIVLESTSALHVYQNINGIEVSPFLNQLKRKAITFERAYTNATETLHSIPPLFNSMWWVSDRYRSLITSEIKLPSFPKILSEEGYNIGFFSGSDYKYEKTNVAMRNVGFDTVVDGHGHPGFSDYYWNYDDHNILQDVKQWIASQKEKFFLMYWTTGGHWPWDCSKISPVFGNKTNYQKYLSLLRHQDTIIQQLVENLETHGYLQNTIIIIVGDHGDGFGQFYGGPGHNGRLLYEDVVRVPFLIYHPKLANIKLVISTPVQHIDVAPTLLNLLKIKVPESFQGRVLLESQSLPNSYVFLNSRDGQIGLIDDNYKFIYDLISGNMALFDVEKDPWEKLDLSHENKEKVVFYKKMLFKWSRFQTSQWEKSAP